MSVLTDARDDLVYDLKNLQPGSDSLLKQAQAIKMISEADINERKHEFDMEKEETRRTERSEDRATAELDRQLRWIEFGIRVMDIIVPNATSLSKTIINNRVKIKRDIMGYNYEETGVIGSKTFNNALKDKYD